MTRTKNYNLYITEPFDKPKFKSWRTLIAGDTNDSNMVIIDNTLKALSERKGIVSIEQTAGTGEAGSVDTYTITFTDNTTYSFTVRNGSDGVGGGSSGENGEDGATFIPHIDADGNLTWTNDKGLENPAPVNIKGTDGTNGIDGVNGVDGQDGRGIVSITRTSGDGSAGSTDTYTITYTDDATSTFTVVNGANGIDGTGGGGASITIDSAMSDTSENAVANKVIKAYIDDLFGDVESAVASINNIIGGAP